MDSWHEGAEAGGRVIARSRGLASLAPNEKRLDALRKEPADYLYYRVVWGELRALASSLIPSVSQPVSGEIVMSGGAIAWRQFPSR